ncbi:MAG: preprotein translocase subunit YajC [Candidatus Faecivicinus sp.]
MMMNLMSALAETTGEVAASGTQTASAGGEMISMIVMLVVMFGVLYFFMIRPQKKKEKAVKNMLDALKPGDRICTIGGLYGTVVALKDDNVTITLGAKQNTVVIARWAVRSVEDAPLENDAEPEI